MISFYIKFVIPSLFREGLKKWQVKEMLWKGREGSSKVDKQWGSEVLASG